MLGEPRVEMSVEHELGQLRLAVRFAASARWTVLFGPSGSGKSTILRMLAGFERPGSGRIAVGGVTVFDSALGISVRADRRRVRWAAQRSVLFAGRTVRWQLGVGLGEGAVDVDGVIAHFGLGALAEKRPEELSGGERQRVAVIRAAAGARGKVLLLDEPFSGLDAVVRDGLIEDLGSWLGESPVVSVTHDVGEAFRLGAEVVRIGAGRVLAQGPVGEVLRVERERVLGVLGVLGVQGG